MSKRRRGSITGIRARCAARSARQALTWMLPVLLLCSPAALFAQEAAPTQIALVFGDYLMGPCDEPADLDGFFTRVDAHRAYKARKRGEDPPPPTTIAPEVLTSIHDAAWTTVQGVPGLAPDATAPVESTHANP